jgi:hypothetical protein
MRYSVSILLAVSHSALLVGGESFDVDGNTHYEQANAYARSTGLQQLRTSSAPELRFWFGDYMIGTVTGVIVSRGRALKCRTSYTYKDGVDTLKRGTCRQLRGWDGSSDVWSQIATLYALNEHRLHCEGVFDGGSFLIEGIYEGKRFALSGSNPDFCEDGPSQAVTRIFRLLPRHRYAP